jgi:TolA-binding protein
MWIVDNNENMGFKIIQILILYSSWSISIALGQSNQDALIANEYYSRGEYDKALTLYQGLEDQLNIIPLIHQNYIDLLHQKQLHERAGTYLTKIRTQAPQNVMYIVDQIDHFIIINDSLRANKVFNDLNSTIVSNANLLRASAQYLVNKQHFDYAEQLYLAARKVEKNAYAYAIQLASLYRYRNQQDKMVDEYLNYAAESPARIRYVKSMLQLTLKDEQELEHLIKKMLKSIQNEPRNDLFAEILIWAHLQQNNYYGAYIQAKALDKRNNTQGENVFEIGKLAIQNKAYEVSIEVLQFLVDNYASSPYYVPAKEYLILAKKESVENKFPIDTIKIRALIVDYEQFINELGLNQYTLAAYREKALLHAFYINETAEAIYILNEVIQNTQADPKLNAQAKIDLADIYIIIDEPWESTLLYSQVEKANKSESIGELAKLKNAKVSFYTGNFKLAQEHLSILKKATRREIANNAIDLSILIKNNTILDSTQSALRDYAAIDLLLYQNKLAEAEAKIIEILPTYAEHPIIDELYWLNAQIEVKKGNYDKATVLLQKIVEELPYDILTDDALYEWAEILENHLNRPEEAKELYQRLMVKYPGSLFVAEARKRFRTLRGDFVN